MKRIYMLSAALLAAVAPIAAQQRPAVDNSKAPILQFESVPDPLKLPAGMNFGEILSVAVNSKGTVVVLNFSYRSESETGQAELARLAGAAGLKVVQNGLRPFKLWDGIAFVLERTIDSEESPCR